jgi:hypothetical protein
MSNDEIMNRCRMTKQGLIMTLRNRGLIDCMNVVKNKNSFIRIMDAPAAAAQGSTVFHPSPAFTGARPGYVFHAGRYGMGYYLDPEHKTREFGHNVKYRSDGVERQDFEERLAKVNEALKYAGGIPQNKWDYGKHREMHENNLKEARKRLEDHKTKISEMVNKCRLRGVDETEIQTSVYRSFSHQHIQLLEQVLAAKKTLEMMDVGTVEELTRQKIAILEELASS